MTPPERQSDATLRALQERAKELDCIYRVEGLLKPGETSVEDIFQALIAVIPLGWQHPEICLARITYAGKTYQEPSFHETPWILGTSIVVQGEVVGRLDVLYTADAPEADEGPFLKEERRLIESIADRIGTFLERLRLQQQLLNLELVAPVDAQAGRQWRVILDFLQRTDQPLLMRISRKMLNHLGRAGVPEAVRLLQSAVQVEGLSRDRESDENRPLARGGPTEFRALTEKTFTIAGGHMSDLEIRDLLQRWIREDKSRFLVQALANPDTTMEEITDAIRRYEDMAPESIEIHPSVDKGLRVALTERFFKNQPDFVNVAKRFVSLDDFFELVQRIAFPPKSRGNLGGKSAGLFLAMQILRKSEMYPPQLPPIRIPKTWYIPSDGILDFIQHNSLEDVNLQKYLDIEQVRQEYPHIVRVFKNSEFGPEIVKGLSVVLDEFEGRPIIVRSSSLLEDNLGAAFSGKYKSLFLANQGSKADRLSALLDAIAEIYASIFSPDAIEYRAERGLLDIHEEMGIMIQEVVGKRVGDYYFPAFAGVAFSRNEFRWSPRIAREDGLVRIVPGLGTRAVDRLKDDYPVLLAPGQPGLRVNTTPEDILRYSPKKIDAINLESGTFETVSIQEVLEQHGALFPDLRRIFSVLTDGHLRTPIGLATDFESNQYVATFDGLIQSSPFLPQLRAVLEILKTALSMPVDIEFASDGNDLYLLQCRPQSHGGESGPVAIPRDIPREKTIFTARKHVMSAKVPNVSHIVFVDPDAYNEIESLDDLKAIGKAVGRLNNVLPKRQFILMGPGRWGSRGDIKLGVSVTYSDINNTAVLIEIARKKESYVPDLSFGTHFFQDLVESSIRYLPLYPDEPNVLYNEPFLRRSPSILAELLPEFRSLEHVLRVIDVGRTTSGDMLQILMSADLDEAVAFLAPPQTQLDEPVIRSRAAGETSDQHWRWRVRLAESIAHEIDPKRFGVEAIYLLGSAKNATAGPASDIDLMVHFRGTPEQRRDLEHWFEGWSLALAEMNFLRTGYRTQGLLDTHIVTDEDIAARTSFTVKIGAVTDPARPLTLGASALP
jgi:hypothetical protein